jgi:hypothetical protein
MDLIVFKISGEKLVKQAMERLKKDVKWAGDYTVTEVAGWGRDFARVRAPVDTTALIRAISYKHLSTSKAMIISDQPVHPIKGTSVPYHIFIETGQVPVNWGRKKGSRSRLYYFTQTANATRDKFAKVLNLRVSEAVVRNG